MRAKLNPTATQDKALREYAGQASLIYNLAVEQHSYQRGHRRKYAPTFAEQARQLTELRAEYEWLRVGSVRAQQQALKDFWAAMNLWFKNPKHFRRPTKRGRHTRTFKIITPKPTLRIYNKRTASVFIPKLGRIKVRLHKRDYSEALKATSYRVSLRPDGWHVAFITEYRGREIEPSEDREAVGIDLGVTTTVVLSNGQHFRSPHRPKVEQRIADMQAARDAAPPRSRERKRLSSQIAAMQHHEASRRADWREKTTTRLVEQYDVIAIENLKPANMQRRPAPKPDPEWPGHFLPNGAAAKAGLNKGLARSGFGAFRMRLEAKAAKAKLPTLVVAVNPRHTSQTCSQCGFRHADNRDRAQFLCLSCGFHFHADHNAARNILSRATVPASAGGLPVQPDTRLVGSALGDANE